MKIINPILPLALACMLSACGGSSSSSSAAPADPGSAGAPPASSGTPLTVNQDSFFVEAGSSLNLDVLANDLGDGLQITSVTTPQFGTVQIQNGELVYTADLNASGTDVLQYEVTDANQQSLTTTVSVLVAPVAFDAAQLLSLFDTDGNGLTEDELLALGVDLPAGFFASADLDGNGVLSESELSQISGELVNVILLPAFNAADLDQSGDLTLEEALNLLPPELATALDTPELQAFTGGLDGTTFSPEDIIALSADLSQAQQDAEQLAGTVMLIDNPFLGGNGDGVLSATELQSGLALAGGALELPAGVDNDTIALAVDLLDLNGDGGLDQQETTNMLTLFNLFTSLTTV